MPGHRYPRSTITACYWRAGIGVFLTAGPVAWGRPVTFLAVILGGLALVFAVYGVLAFLRSRTQYMVTDEGIVADGPLPRRIPWSQLAALQLSYYATKWDHDSGWLQLKIKGAGRTMRIESTLDGFPAIVARAVAEARAHGVELLPTTLENLRPLGLAPEHEGEPPCPTS